MLRLTCALCARSITLASSAFAADAAASPEIQQAVAKACNDALDRGTFGDDNTAEEYVDATARRMAKAQNTAAMKGQSVADVKAVGRPN